MAHDFYPRARALLEEFQKKELHYLSIEKQLNSSISLKKDHNLPLQEYLQRINKREKKTEETYTNLMKQMEELDRHTDLISLKLEKLDVLKRNIKTFSVSNWPSLVNSNTVNEHAYQMTSSFNTKANNFSLLQPLQQNLRSVSTQTETDIYCDKCKSEVSLHDHFKHSKVTENLQVSNVLSLSGILPSAAHADFSKHPSESENAKQTAPSAVITPYSSMQVDSDKNFETKDSKTVRKVDTVTPKVNVDVLVEENIVTKQNLSADVHDLNKTKISFNDKENISSRNKELTQHISEAMLTEKIEKSDTVRDNVNDSVLKSDQESMNHEFDFLETTTCSIKQDNENKKNNESLSNKRFDLKTQSQNEEQRPANLRQKDINEKNLHQNPIIDILNDDKSDVSFSITGHESPPSPSPNMSAVSDSDSLSGKETPLKASAAYQALLGNTSIVENRSKQLDSDSDSLNEVETVLANAVRKKSLLLPKTLIQQSEEESALSQTETSTTKKASKSAPVNKPQSKLSKNTRKVLGLDTSSGSEVELAVKPSNSKIEEDSDEFDFYD